jgi:hypothetical protein
MESRFLVGEYEIEYSAIQLEAAFHAHVSVRLRRRYEEERLARYTYYTEYDSAEAALAEARRQAELVRGSPRGLPVS